MKKIFDSRRGHYVVLNEDDANASANAGENTEQANAAAEQAKKNQELNIKTLEQLSRLDVEKSNIQKNYQTTKSNIENNYGKDIAVQQELIASANQAVSAAVDAASRSRAVSDILNIKKKIADIELKKVEDQTKADLDYAKELHRIEYAKIQVQANANASSVAERWNRLPAKYRVLNESRLNQAKIYMKNLIDAASDTLIKDMRDFKKYFKESNLVYGKDNKDYFVICIDQDDFNELYTVLQEVGYMRDEIFAVVMPQILDRSAIVDSGLN